MIYKSDGYFYRRLVTNFVSKLEYSLSRTEQPTRGNLCKRSIRIKIDRSIILSGNLAAAQVRSNEVTRISQSIDEWLTIR